MRSNTNTEKIIAIVCILLMCLALLPYFWLSQYANPVADDFSYAFLSWQNNLFPALTREYLYWNGRYTSNIFVLCNPITYGNFILYKTTPILLVIFHVICSFLLIKTICDKSIKSYSALAVSLLYNVLCLNQMPDISEGLYWYTAAVTYQLGYSFMLIYAALSIKLWRKQYVGNNQFLHLALMLLFIAFTVGFNEIIMLILAIVSFGTVCIIWFNFPDKRKTAFFLFIVTLSFSGAVFFAPGNSVRESNFVNDKQLVYSFIMASAQTVRFLSEWLSSSPLFLLSIIYWYVNKRLVATIEIFRKSFYLNPFQAIVIILFIVFIGSFPAYWSTGILGQHRTMNLSYSMFIPAWFVFLTVLYNQYHFAFPDLSFNMKIVLVMLIFISLEFTHNGYNALIDIQSGEAKAFDGEMKARFSAMKQANDTVYFAPIRNRSKTVFIYDLTHDERHWQNSSYSQFFSNSTKTVKVAE